MSQAAKPRTTRTFKYKHHGWNDTRRLRGQTFTISPQGGCATCMFFCSHAGPPSRSRSSRRTTPTTRICRQYLCFCLHPSRAPAWHVLWALRPGAQIQARSRRSQLLARYWRVPLPAAAALPAATTREMCGSGRRRSLVPMSLLLPNFGLVTARLIHHACTTRTWETRTSPRAVRPQSKTPLPEAPRRLRWGAEREETYHFHAFRNIKTENSADTFARGLAKRNLIGEE